jgi:hypothetical protein
MRRKITFQGQPPVAVVLTHREPPVSDAFNLLSKCHHPDQLHRPREIVSQRVFEHVSEL